MVLSVNTPDPLITCPLDESHRILKSRMQFHLVRCLKNHKLDKKIKCPWNPLHIIDKFAYEDHWRNKCEDLPNAMASVVIGIQDAEKSNINIVPASVTDAKLPPMDEDWDADAYCSTYDPIKSSEGKPVLRCAIGLSKAKRKEWHRQERLRYQQLDEVLPIQIKSTCKQMKQDSCRPPRNSGIAMSANASTVDEFNTSRISTEEVSLQKLPTNLRAPHSQSAGLNYTPNDTISGCSHDQTRSLFDETFGSETEHMYGTSSYWLENVMHGLENRRIDSDARSCASTSSKSSRIASLRKFLDQPVDVEKNNYATAGSSGMKERAKMDTAKIQQQNGNACLPLIEPTSSAMDEEVVDQLAQLLANLESKEKKLQEEKAAILAKFSRDAPKSMNLKTNKANGENRHDSTPTMDEGSSLGKTQNVFLNEMPKCAANFSKFKKTENPPIIGAGRGCIVDHDLFKNRKPGLTTEKENADPFA